MRLCITIHWRRERAHGTAQSTKIIFFSKLSRAVKNIFPIVASALEVSANLEQKASLGFDPNR